MQKENGNLPTTKISLSTATIVGMNAMIGSGIFIAPAALASNVGPAGILAYGFVIIAVWAIALSLAELASSYPAEGSFFLYASQWGGKGIGIIASGSYIIGCIVSMGLLIRYAGSHLQALLPSLSNALLSYGSLAALTALNLGGIQIAAWGQQLLIICTTFPIVATTILCLTKMSLANLLPFAPYGFGNVFPATRKVIFSFFGFESAASLFTIVQNPHKNVPRALTYSIIAVGSLYLCFVSAIIAAIPLSLFSDPLTPLAVHLHNLFPHLPWLVNMIHFAIISAILGTIHSVMWGISELSYTLIEPYMTSKFVKKHLLSLIILFVSGAMAFFTFIVPLDHIDLFFSTAAFLIVSAYLLSLFTLLMPAHRKSIFRTSCGIITAAVILYFAIEGIITELHHILPSN